LERLLKSKIAWNLTKWIEILANQENLIVKEMMRSTNLKKLKSKKLTKQMIY